MTVGIRVVEKGDHVALIITKGDLERVKIAILACRCTDCRAVQSSATEKTRSVLLKSIRQSLAKPRNGDVKPDQD